MMKLKFIPVLLGSIVLKTSVYSAEPEKGFEPSLHFPRTAQLLAEKLDYKRNFPESEVFKKSAEERIEKARRELETAQQDLVRCQEYQTKAQKQFVITEQNFNENYPQLTPEEKFFIDVTQRWAEVKILHPIDTLLEKSESEKEKIMNEDILAGKPLSIEEDKSYMSILKYIFLNDESSARGIVGESFLDLDYKYTKKMVQ